MTTASAPRRGQTDPRPARQRLLDAAGELFYAEGVHSVGIDRVIERAGVAKASLYNTFGSKEALVGAYLDARHVTITGHLQRAIDAAAEPRDKILAVFDAQAQLFRQPGFRGCAFVAARAEAPPGGQVDQAAGAYRSWIRGTFTELVEAAGARDPATLGAQLHLLYDGGSIAANLDRDPAIATASRAAAQALLDAATGAVQQADDDTHP